MTAKRAWKAYTQWGMGLMVGVEAALPIHLPGNSRTIPLSSRLAHPIDFVSIPRNRI